MDEKVSDLSGPGAGTAASYARRKVAAEAARPRQRTFEGDPPVAPDDLTPSRGGLSVSGRNTRLGVPNVLALSLPALAADALVIVLTSVITGEIYLKFSPSSLQGFSDFLSTGTLIALLFCAIMRLTESHQPFEMSSSVRRARDAILVWVGAFALFLFMVFALKVGSNLSRGATLLFFLVGLIATTVSRVNIPNLLTNLNRTSGAASRELILVGANGCSMLARIEDVARSGICAGAASVTFDAGCANEAWPRERRRVIDRVLDLARVSGSGEIFIAATGIPQDRLRAILRGLSIVPRAILVVPDEATASFMLNRMTVMGPCLAVEVQKEPLSAFERAMKRLMDIVLSTIAVVFLSPLFAAIALAVKMDSPGPVFFSQRRNGHKGRPFRIVKFRTMTVLEDGSAVMQARRDDVRTTRVGRWLRKTSLDELPQLFNVLNGSMSLVGPRPHALAHDEFYAGVIENYTVRQHVKPGITGWAQVNGFRGETPTVDLMYRRIELDLWYAINCSLWLDVQILFRTIFEVLRQRNAF